MGVIDPAQDAVQQESRRSINDHLDDYANKLKASKRSPQHIQSTVKYIRMICESSGFTNAAAINADLVSRFAAELLSQGKSARTAATYLTAIKGFTRWLACNNKLQSDPLKSVKKPNAKASRKRERRMLLPAEWEQLEAVTQSAVASFGMHGHERVLLYWTAIETGLRAAELRSLTRGNLHLASEPPYITCKRGDTKNSELARQNASPELANQLRRYIATKAPGAKVFSLPSKYDVADMLRADLNRSRKAWIDAARHDPAEQQRRREGDFLAATNHDGDVLDFHALRHTCGAWLAMTGAHPKTVQSVMRHSTITLTMDTYGHPFPGEEASAVAKLPELMRGPGEPTISATGTHDASPSSGAAYALQSGRETLQSGAPACDEDYLPSASSWPGALARTPCHLPVYANQFGLMQGRAMLQLGPKPP